MAAVMSSWLPSRRRERRSERSVSEVRYGDKTISAPMESGWNNKSFNASTNEIVIFGNDDSDHTLVNSSPDLSKDDIIIIGEDNLFDSTTPEPSPTNATVTIVLPETKRTHKRTTSAIQEDKVSSITPVQSLRARSQSQPPVPAFDEAGLAQSVPYEDLPSTTHAAPAVSRSNTPGAQRRAPSPLGEQRISSPFREGRRTASPLRSQNARSPFAEQRSWSSRTTAVERHPSLVAVSILSPVSEDFPRGQPSPAIDVASFAAPWTSPPPPSLPVSSMPDESTQAPHPSQSPVLLSIARHVHSPEQIERATSGMSQRTAFRRPSTSNGVRPEIVPPQTTSPPLDFSRPGSRGVGIGETGFMRASSRGPLDMRSQEPTVDWERVSRRAQSVEPVMYRQRTTYETPLTEPVIRIEPTVRVRERNSKRGQSMPRPRDTEHERRRHTSRARSSHRDLERSSRRRRDSVSSNDASGEDTSDEVEIGLDTRAEAAYPSMLPNILPNTTYVPLPLFPDLPAQSTAQIVSPPRSNMTTPLATQNTLPLRAHTVSPSMMGHSFHGQHAALSIDSRLSPEPLLRAQTSLSVRPLNIHRRTPEPEKPNGYLTDVAADYASIVQEVAAAMNEQEEAKEAREGRSIVRAASRVASRAASRVRGGGWARDDSRARPDVEDLHIEGLNIRADVDVVESDDAWWG